MKNLTTTTRPGMSLSDLAHTLHASMDLPDEGPRCGRVLISDRPFPALFLSETGF